MKQNGRRMKIRAASFIIAAFAALAAFAAINFHRARQSDLALNYTYQRALSELSTYVDNIDASLTKTIYSGTSSFALTNAAKVWRESAAAKACLASLPYSDVRLEGTNKFISQVGEYAYSLTNRAAAGNEITEDERGSLLTLSKYAASLKNELSDMLREIAEADYSKCAVLDELNSDFDGNFEQSSFAKMEGSYEDYPSLIYDGPFSDHLLQQEFKALEGAAEVSESDAGNTAKRLLGDGVTYAGKTQGDLPVYVFMSGDGNGYLELTVRGGRPLLYSDHRGISETNYSVSEAVGAAKEFLLSQGIRNMEPTYYLEDQNSVVVNFAYSDEGALCYTDLIKVKIAMDDLSTVGFEAAGYLANHTKRSKPEKKISADEARESVSRYLTVESVREAFICPLGLTEYYVYEFRCTAEDGREVLSFIDACTGREVDILLLLHTPGGTLTV